jgi:ligand-binding sensor domain-containing protein
MLAPAVASASGAWQTFQHPYHYTDLLATRDTVWCATAEAGLQILYRPTGSFTSAHREPSGLASNKLTSLAVSRSGTLWVGTSDAGVSQLKPNGAWGLLNAFDGLPSLNVNTLRAQGDTLWIGTDKGIALYNGTEISGRLPDGSGPSPFANNDIHSIAVRGDTVWVGTATSVYYSRISAALGSWTNPVGGGLPADTVRALATDGTNVWALVGTSVWLAQAGDTWAQIPGLGNVYRLSDDSGVIVASTDGGILQWDGAGWPNLNASLVSTDVQPFAATCDPAGVVFAANLNGLFQQQSGAWASFVPSTPPGNNCQNVVVDASRTYMGTYDEGIGRFDGTSWTNWLPRGCTTDCASTPYDPVFAFGMLVDHQGYKWFGFWSSSVDQMDDSPTTPVVQHDWVSTTLADDRHTWLWSSAADDSGGRWFGMDTPCLDCDQQHDPIGIDYYSPSGIFRKNFHTGEPDTALNMANNQIRSLAYDGVRRTMWVGYAGHGVQSFTLPDSNGRAGATHDQPVVFNNLDDTSRLDVFAVQPHSDSVWVFSTDALRLYTGYGAGNNGEPLLYSIPAAPAQRGAIHPMDIAADGTLWLGTANGVRIYHPGGATEDLTVDNSPLADDDVRSVRIDHATGAVWIATARGLNRYDPGYVPPPPPQLASLTVKLYPNPAPIANLLGTPIHISGNATSYSGKVYSIEGRLVRHLPSAGNGTLLWDGRDDHGVQVRPGLYFVRVEAGGRSATTRVTLLR